MRAEGWGASGVFYFLGEDPMWRRERIKLMADIGPLP